MGAAIGSIGGETIGQGGVRGRVSIDPSPQGLSPPGKAVCGPTTRPGLRPRLQGGRIDQARRYGLVTGLLVLCPLVVDRKNVVWGKSVYVRVALVDRRINKQKQITK